MSSQNTNQQTLHEVPARLRPWILTAAIAHLIILAICWSSSWQLSTLANHLLGLLAPYTTTFNLRMDLQPLAITDDVQLTAPISVRFRHRDEQFAGPWIEWSNASQVPSTSISSRLRRDRYLRQVIGLLAVESTDGMSQMVAAMLRDIEVTRQDVDINEFEIIELPTVRANEWLYAEQFRKSGNLPEGLQPTVLVSARIVHLENGEIGILPELPELQTVPVLSEAAAK